MNQRLNSRASNDEPAPANETLPCEAFLADQIGVGHALEIAKLPQSQQLKAFDAAFRTVWNGGKDSRVLLPLRDFTAFEQNILLSLDSIPFDKNDSTLVPEAGSCAECPKRTGFNALLFGEMSQRDQCSDATCCGGPYITFKPSPLLCLSRKLVISVTLQIGEIGL